MRTRNPSGQNASSAKGVIGKVKAQTPLKGSAFTLLDLGTLSPPVVATVTVNQKPLIDTGQCCGAVTLESMVDTLTTSNALLKTYTGELMSVLKELKSLNTGIRMSMDHP